MDIWISIVVTFVLVLVNGYFSMSEMALVNARHVLLQHDADEGDKSAQRALGLAADSGQFLATIQVAITLVGFFASAAAATNLSDPLAQWLSGFNIGWLSVIAPGLAPVVITLIVSYLSIVVGELVPKRIALADAERVSKMVAGPLMVFQKIASPLVALTSASANGLSRLFGIKNADERQNVSEEEIKYMVTDNDELLEDEKRMIHDILDLGDMTVHEIMTPRVDVMFAEDTDTVRQTVERMRGTGYSRLPVYHEDIDRIVGIVHFKDLVAPLMDGKEHEPVAEYAYEAMFVPETKDLFPLLAEVPSPELYRVSHEEALPTTLSYKLLEKNVEAARLQQKLKVGQYLPTVGIGAGYMYHNLLDKDRPFGMVFATVAIPISDWWGGSHAIRKQKLQVKAAEYSRQNANELLLVQMRKLWNELEESYKQVKLSEESIATAEENVRLNTDYYKAGTVTLSDLLDAQSLLQQSRDQYTGDYTAYLIKRTEYLQATGR